MTVTPFSVSSEDARAGPCDVVYISTNCDLIFYVYLSNILCERKVCMFVSEIVRHLFFLAHCDRQFLIEYRFDDCIYNYILKPQVSWSKRAPLTRLQFTGSDDTKLTIIKSIAR